MAVDYQNDDVIFENQFLAIKRAIEGNAIVTGGALSVAVAPSPMEVRIATVTYYANGTKVVKGGNTDLVVGDGHATFDRWDLLLGKSDTTVYLLAGTPAAAPKPATMPADETLLGMVLIPATTVTLTAGMLHEFGFVSTLFLHGSQHDIAASDPITDLGNHNARHENGGGDEINLAGLSGQVADDQPVDDHDHSGSGSSLGGPLGAKVILGSMVEESEIEGKHFALEASAVTRNSNDAQKGSAVFAAGNPATKVKEILVNERINACRIYFEMRSIFSFGSTFKAMIFKNGVALGTLWTTADIGAPDTYITRTEDFGSFEVGDLIQINVSGDNVNETQVKNMRLQYDQKGFATFVIDPRSVTNQDP